MTEQDGTTTIAFDPDNSIVLPNVHMAQLNPGDFVLI
jgi:hypothetical protein